MIPELLSASLKHESAAINLALHEALKRLPDSVQPVAQHIFDAGGKRLRPFLTVICARIFGFSDPSIYPLASCLEMLHAATLLHDDILDDAETRRGKKSAHLVFGPKETILAGDALLALGNAIVAEYNKPSLSACYSSATIDTAAGEILEMGSLHDPTLDAEQYLRIARGKTACLISQACVMGAVMADAPGEMIYACGAFGDNLGLAFQLVDDALDFYPGETTGKPRGGDLREGKMTPPIRLFRASLTPEMTKEFDRDFSLGRFTDQQIEELGQAILPFARASLNLADDCIKKAIAALDSLPPGKNREILQQLAAYVRNRNN